MYDYVLIHGSYGHPFENWGPWLFNELSKEEKNVLAPQFPCINQNYNNWKKVMESYLPFIDEKTSFVGHSLGPAFVLDFLLEYDLKVNNLYFAAPFYGLIDIKEFDEVNKSFFIYDDLEKTREHYNRAFCFFSDNDPYVPRCMSEDISKSLNAHIEIIHNGGHLNASAGIIEFNELKKAIEKNG